MSDDTDGKNDQADDSLPELQTHLLSLTELPGSSNYPNLDFDAIPVLTEVVAEGKLVQPSTSVLHPVFPQVGTSQHQPAPKHLPEQPLPDHVPAEVARLETSPEAEAAAWRENLLSELGFDTGPNVPVHDLSDFQDHGELEFSVLDVLVTETETEDDADVVAMNWPITSVTEPGTKPGGEPETEPEEEVQPVAEALLDEIVASMAEDLRDSLEATLKRQIDAAIHTFLDQYSPRLRRIARTHLENCLAKTAGPNRRKKNQP